MKTIKQLLSMKEQKEKISMITAYDYPSAKQAEAAGIDTILVGDSLGMVVLGYDSTVEVTMEDMIHHAKAVRRGAPESYVIVDVPFGAVGIDHTTDMKNAIQLYKDTNANAVKIEGVHTTLIQGCT
ncbi:3-methyl-2-oxobutanoate hydroxymethyltransferase, partial [Mammaliicoccus sciuri]|uniref:3-methyl-2-oxobutanoate hydroxymethyltransferase n=1 Tax=Mammaliicoccus sciuri TaxID=1296 RepID=UPI002270AB8B